MKNLCCWNCGRSLDDIPRPISRHANCPQCFEVLHCCRLCRWYQQGRPLDCDHDRADPPVEKEVANFCDYFSPRPNAFEPAGRAQQAAAAGKLASLFGEEPDAGSEQARDSDETRPATKSRLDDLFDD